MQDFQAYQAEFSAHVRNPQQFKKPANVIEKRMAVYRELVFNNLLNTISPCYPVCVSLLGARKWQQLIRQYMTLCPSETPIFREIPAPFLTFLNVQNLPEYIKQLAHYEWVELAVASHTAEVTAHTHAIQAHQTIVLNPTAFLLQYDYAVQTISKKNKPKLTENTFLLVFRNTDFDVKFIALNPATFALLTLLQTHDLTVSKCLKLFAAQISQPLEVIEQFGLEILQDLANQQAVTA